MAYSPLDSRIIHSTIWREADHVRILWITMLAMCDRNGYVGSSLLGLADAAKLSLQNCEDGLTRLSSPDRYSRSKDLEGRRIESVDGGWTIVNYPIYRAQCREEIAREKAAKRQRDWYSRQKLTENRSKEASESLGITEHNTKSPNGTERNGTQLNGTEPILSTEGLNTGASAPSSPAGDKPAKKLPLGFIEFWNAYPAKGKESKKNALAVWNSQNLESRIADVLAGVGRWKLSQRWADGFVKAAHRFLKDEMFEAEPPPAAEEVKPGSNADRVRKMREDYLRYENDKSRIA